MSVLLVNSSVTLIEQTQENCQCVSGAIITPECYRASERS